MADIRNALPFDVVEAAVAVAGRAFYYKSSLKRLLLRSGVPITMYDRHAHEAKFVLARAIFSELEAKGELGNKIAINILEEMLSIRQITENGVDKVEAFSAIESLRQLAKAALIETAAEESLRKRREEFEQQRLSSLTRRNQTLSKLYSDYASLVKSQDFQGRGYALETLLKELFISHELEYRPSYRGPAQQIDGAFKFEKFDYLVEIKWTSSEADLAQLLAFKGKVDAKIQSTRGLFLSMNGFRGEVIQEFQQGSSRNVILMDGQDLVYILEGRIELTDALELKTTKAAQEGIIFVSLREHV